MREIAGGNRRFGAIGSKVANPQPVSAGGLFVVREDRDRPGFERDTRIVGLDRLEAAGAALEQARADAPQNPEGWLLSATLARRQDDLSGAASFIAVAAALAPDDPRIALEAGTIAILANDEEAARRNWQRVRNLAPDSAEATVAAGYLAQLDGSGE